MPKKAITSTAFQIIVLADVTPRPDGTFVLRPQVPDTACDTWIEVKEAAKLIGVCLENCYDLVKDGYLVSRHPLDRKILISLKSVRTFYQATVNPAFWTAPDLRKSHIAAVRAAQAALCA